jgi:hypothetical protein
LSVLFLTVCTEFFKHVLLEEIKLADNKVEKKTWVG